MMSIVKADIVGYYSFKPDFEIKSYSEKEDKSKIECVICKRSIYEPSYDHITDNSKLQEEPQLIIGKCGHISGNITCPIDKVEWNTHRVADSITKLVLESARVNKRNTAPNNLKRVMRKKKIVDL
jgi:hypothetical protein